LLLVSHRVEFPQVDHHVVLVSQAFGNRELKAEAHQESDVHGEQRFNVVALREAVKVLLVNLHVRVHQRQGTHNLSKEQVHRRAHLHKEMKVVESAAAVQAADHDDNMTLERME
jgi:hypothetical protein